MFKKEEGFFLACLVGASITTALCIMKIRSGQIEMADAGHSYRLPAGTTSSEILASTRNLCGKKDAPATVVEFADYQCPPCKRVHTEHKSLLARSSCDWRLVFRQYPLVRIHPYAFDAAVAAEAAAEQGKFWEMHDLLFEHSNQLASTEILSYARSLHLDIARFKSALKHSAKIRVAGDMDEGDHIKLEGTPTLLLCEHNGTVSPITLAQLRKRCP